MKTHPRKGFSLIELSVVILIVGILVLGISKSSRIIQKARLTSAQDLTKKSAITLIPDLVLWLEPTLDGSLTGNTAAQIGNGEKILSWNDISTNKNIISQASGTNQPTYLTNGINNLPTLSFDGVNNYLFSLKAPLNSGDDTFTYVGVWKLNDPNSLGGVLFDQNTNSSLQVGRRAAFNTVDLNRCGFNGEENDYNNVPYNGRRANAGIITLSSNGTVKVYNSTNTPSQGSIDINVENVSNGVFMIGAKGLAGRSEFLGAQISEIMVFDRDLKPSEVAIINSYLSQKYNIKIQ